MVTHIDAEQSSHPVEIIGVIGHTQHLGYDGVLSPLGSKLLHQLHKVAGGCLTDSIHWKKKKKEINDNVMCYGLEYECMFLTITMTNK